MYVSIFVVHIVYVLGRRWCVHAVWEAARVCVHASIDTYVYTHTQLFSVSRVHLCVHSERECVYMCTHYI